MKNLLTSVCIIVLAGLFLSIPLFAAGPPAFPTAEGYGMYATGGRGGKVVAVTNLLDDAQGSIPGSFRWALRQYPNEPLTIVFKTSGVINLVTQLGPNEQPVPPLPDKRLRATASVYAGPNVILGALKT